MTKKRYTVERHHTFNDKLINFIFEGSPYFPIDNFYPDAKCEFEGMVFMNSEAAFQAAKVLDMDLREKFTDYDPGLAKFIGKQPNLTPLRKDWNEVKDQVMYDIVLSKMQHNPLCLESLMLTGFALIIEGNYWHDNYWGVDFRDGSGYNQLGVTLMKLREEFRLGKVQALSDWS